MVNYCQVGRLAAKVKAPGVGVKRSSLGGPYWRLWISSGLSNAAYGTRKLALLSSPSSSPGRPR